MRSGDATGSIKRRLVVQLGLVTALLSIAFFLAVRVVAEKAATDTQDNILAASATSIVEAVYSDSGEVRLELPYSAITMLSTVSEDRVFYRVLVDGETITGYDDLPLPEGRATGIGPVFDTYPFRGEALRTVQVARTLSVQDQPRQVNVVVGQTRLGLGAISSRITTNAVAIGTAFFLVATALSFLAAQNAIAPLDRLAQVVARRGPNDLRPVTAAAPVELVPLVGGLNSFMERLRQALTRSEDLITEAAHRVRTPLATVRTQAEVIHRQTDHPASKKALREMIRAVDESSRSAGQLLDHAMVTFRSDQLETQEINAADLLRDVVDRLQPTAELKDIHLALELDDDPVTVRGDIILLQNAVRNLVDNAIKYSPADTDILIKLSGEGACQMAFIDQGRGFGEADLTQLTSRFSRGKNVDDVVGSGLGLTIADDVARAHGGALDICSNQEGPGACVTLVLPLS